MEYPNSGLGAFLDISECIMSPLFSEIIMSYELKNIRNGMGHYEMEKLLSLRILLLNSKLL